jgi:hypothetical protein
MKKGSFNREKAALIAKGHVMGNSMGSSMGSFNITLKYYLLRLLSKILRTRLSATCADVFK